MVLGILCGLVFLGFDCGGYGCVDVWFVGYWYFCLDLVGVGVEDVGWVCGLVGGVLFVDEMWNLCGYGCFV